MSDQCRLVKGRAGRGEVAVKFRPIGLIRSIQKTGRGEIDVMGNIPPHFGSKPYFSFKQFLSQRFDFPVHKLCVDAGFTCPNRDGRVGSKGCSYCYNPGFSLAASDASDQTQTVGANLCVRPELPGQTHRSAPTMSIQEQIQAFSRKGRRRGKFLVYFQPYTNTYASTEVLKTLYDAALQAEDAIGLCIGTRPDCVPDDVLDLIQGYARDYHVWLEYGLQSIHDQTLAAINRGHGFHQFEDAVRRSRGRGIFSCVHLILGLPGESREDMIETIRTISRMGIHGVKLHHLQVMKNTPLAEEFYQGMVRVFTVEEYIPLLCDLLEHLSPEITVQRLFGEVTKDDLLIAPCWRESKTEMLAAIEAEFLRRGSFQGAHSIQNSC